MEERRRVNRAVPAHDTTIMVGGNRPARVMNISPVGVLLELASALNPRWECRLALPLPGGNVQVRARVSRCRLTARAQAGPTGGLVYQAALELLDIPPKLARAIEAAYPPEAVKPARQAPTRTLPGAGGLVGSRHGAN